MFILGLLGFVLAVVLVVGAAYTAGRATSKLVGLPSFRLFDVKTPRALAREPIIYIACTAAVLAVSIALFFLGVLIGGQAYASNRVDVTPGMPAQLAGISGGDRIVEVDGIVTPDFATTRALVRSSAKSHTLTIERGTHRRDFSVTPEANGAIGIEAITEYRRATVLEALVDGIQKPWAIWSSLLRPAQNMELAGPVGIARAVSHERSRGLDAYLLMIGLLVCVLCWTIPATFINDWLCWILFRWIHSKTLRAHPTEPQMIRMHRLYHAMKVNLGYLVVCLAWFAWEDMNIGIWFAWFGGAVAPVLWRICRELHSRRKAIGIILLMFIPLVNVVAIAWQTNAARQWLRQKSTTPQGAAEAVPVN